MYARVLAMSGEPDGPRAVPNAETARLFLTPVRMAELDEVAALHADERVWTHLPQGRHPSVDHTRTKIDAMEHQWSRDGLGYWVARLRQPLAGLSIGDFVGIGGCAIESDARWWNLYYRFRPESQGNGLAAELCQAALLAARSVNAERPVVARLVEHNRASKATAERAGLRLQWRGPDSDGSDAVRLVYADRSLDAELLGAIKRYH